MSTPTAQPWLPAPEGYQVALLEGKVAARNSKGRVLSSVPAKLKDSEEVKSLRALQEWLDRHERECRARVEEWMLRSLPIPAPLVTAVWSDPAWAAPMQDLVVAPVDPDGRPAWANAGLLRAVAADGIKVVDLDGDTRVVRHPAFVAAHPVLLDELADWQELAVDLRATQGTDQLWRTTFARPGGVSADARSVNDFDGGRFDQLRFVLGRCRSLGFGVQGGYSVVPVWESGHLVEARFWVGSGNPEYRTEVGPLVWVDADGSTLSLGQVGKVAYSEGVRMASMVFAGRKTQEGS